MNPAYLDRKNTPLAEPRLKKARGDLYPSCKEILELADAFDHKWKHYGAKTGWLLKAVRKGKALFWLTRLKELFRIGFSVGEKEREHLLKSSISSESKQQLAAAKKYPEGYHLQLEIQRRPTRRMSVQSLKFWRNRGE